MSEVPAGHIDKSIPEALGVESPNSTMDHVDKKRRTNGNRDQASNTAANDTKELLMTINKIDNTNSKVDKMNNNLTSRLDVALQKIGENRKDINELKDKQQHNDFELNETKDRVKELEKENQRMKERFVDLAARKMRCKAVYFGFPEGCEKGNCEGLILSFAESHLDMQGQDLRIERAHRSGQVSKRGAPRPIMVAFNRYTTRSTVLASARKLLKNKPFVYEDKENPIFIDEMLPKEIRDLRKKMSHTRQKLKEEHRRAYFKYQQGSSTATSKHRRKWSIRKVENYRHCQQKEEELKQQVRKEQDDKATKDTID